MKFEYHTESGDPTAPLITWSTLKARTHAYDDQQSEVMDIAAGRISHAEEAMQCTLSARHITATFWADDFPTCGGLTLPRGPVIEIVSISDANEHTPTYELRRIGRSDRLHVTSTVTYPLTVVYRAGYESAADVPAAILDAVKTDICTRFMFREALATTSVNQVFDLDAFYRRNSRGTPIA